MDDATLPPMPPPRSPSPTLPEHIPQPNSGSDPRSLPEVEKEHPNYSDNNEELESANSSHDVAAFVPLKEEAPDTEGKLEGGKQKRKRTRYAGLYHYLPSAGHIVREFWLKLAVSMPIVIYYTKCGVLMSLFL